MNSAQEEAKFTSVPLKKGMAVGKFQTQGPRQFKFRVPEKGAGAKR